jgi:predicted nucleic acid-binding protein
MTLNEIEEGSAIFIDANVFIYHFTGASQQCSAFLERCRAREISATTSVLVLREVCHRLMMLEAVKKGLVSPGNVARKLAERPNIISQLIAYETDVESIPAMRIEVAAVTEHTFMQAVRLQRRYGLLTNDSMIVATMLRDGFRLLATADRRLASVSDIETAVPTDLETKS